MKASLKTFLIIFIVIAAIAGGVFVYFKKSSEAPRTLVEEAKELVVPPPSETLPSAENSSQPEAEKTAVIPSKISLKVPFTSQAPLGVWDDFHEEACEEASLIMLHAYLAESELTPNSAENEIQKMIDFEIKRYGDYKDTSAEESVKLYNDYFGEPVKFTLKVIYDFGKEDIKKELASGNPVIVPAAGRKLGNPYFTQPGPLYHMLLLKGYSGDQIITNDPGTRRGENYRYQIDTLYNAIHDFPGRPENIEQGRKAMIVLEKK